MEVVIARAGASGLAPRLKASEVGAEGQQCVASLDRGLVEMAGGKALFALGAARHYHAVELHVAGCGGVRGRRKKLVELLVAYMPCGAERAKSGALSEKFKVFHVSFPIL
jgi:hypothetical protein